MSRTSARLTPILVALVATSLQGSANGQVKTSIPVHGSNRSVPVSRVVHRTAQVSLSQQSKDKRDTKESKTESKKRPPAFSSLFAPVNSIDIARAVYHAEGEVPANKASVYRQVPVTDTTAGLPSQELSGFAYQFRYQPLYFEERNPERCGLGRGCATTLVSAGSFFGRLPVLPFLMLKDHPRDCVDAGPECPACHEFVLHEKQPQPFQRIGWLESLKPGSYSW